MKTQVESPFIQNAWGQQCFGVQLFLNFRIFMCNKMFWGWDQLFISKSMHEIDLCFIFRLYVYPEGNFIQLSTSYRRFGYGLP